MPVGGAIESAAADACSARRRRATAETGSSATSLIRCRSLITRLGNRRVRRCSMRQRRRESSCSRGAGIGCCSSAAVFPVQSGQPGAERFQGPEQHKQAGSAESGDGADRASGPASAGSAESADAAYLSLKQVRRQCLPIAAQGVSYRANQDWLVPTKVWPSVGSVCGVGGSCRLQPPAVPAGAGGGDSGACDGATAGPHSQNPRRFGCCQSQP
jgi:hypothetical protein